MPVNRPPQNNPLDHYPIKPDGIRPQPPHQGGPQGLNCSNLRRRVESVTSDSDTICGLFQE